ncbi:MAG: glycosyl transferase family protein [Amycolatopsis sp.]|jgi:peptidoglycan/xylan/chitin deacetylase (PgdA/CDA1 family)|uniref:polysaccharide deacetylase family protein n=1 Tax=Amycolatopsis sp. TaxID=37632 RepID=UPI00260EA12A|nr:polysaccharide deacetylase family protein [Amycolatopsis sp.]MCU1686025.1 glycosyl transferase family protein [Amycolatopsis sp.]
MSSTVVNLTVHGIGRPRRALDPGENESWVTVEQFERVLDAVAERDDVNLTFDDGNSSDVEIALPRLVERGLTAEFFPLAGGLGERGRVDRDGVRALADAGMAIGSHGWAHRDWRRLGEAGFAQELTEASSLLADAGGAPVERVALPFGFYDRRVLERLRMAGVVRAYSNDGSLAREGDWLQSRTSLPCDLDRDWVDIVVAGKGMYRQVARRAARYVKIGRR